MPARRRIKIRRVAKFVRSIKHYFFRYFSLVSKNLGFGRLFVPAEPLILYGFMRSALFLHPLLLLQSVIYYSGNLRNFIFRPVGVDSNISRSCKQVECFRTHIHGIIMLQIFV